MTGSKISADIQEFLERKTTKDFLSSAREFLQILETENISNEEFYKKSHLSLSQLYSAGHKLEEIPLKYSSDETELDDNRLFENNNKNHRQISELGKDNFYFEVFDPIYENNKEPSQGFLEDDFGDIYRDLKINLCKIDLIGTDEAIEDALWEMKWSFLNHWGQHCINALRALHYLVYDGKHCM